MLLNDSWFQCEVYIIAQVNFELYEQEILDIFTNLVERWLFYLLS